MAITPSQVFTSAGTTVSIAAAPAAYTGAGFAALTFVPIGEIVDIGEYGKKFKLVTHNPIGNRATIKRKGSFDTGSVTLKLGRVPSDSGQAAIITARDSDNSYSFKVVLQNGTINYFTAQVLSYTTMIGSVDSITSANVQIEIDNDIIEI